MEFGTKLVITLLGLHLLSWGFNALVAWLESRGHHDGYVSLLVVVGAAYTVTATLWLIGMEAYLILTAAFVASGIPMIVGSVARHIRARSLEERRMAAHARKISGE
ncbi:MAG: hypothetical protein ACLFU8_17220 [Anaerolineales bacterium]